MDKLEKKVNEFYQSQSLSNDKVRDIVRRGRYQKLKFYLLSFRVAAALMIGLGILIGVLLSEFSSENVTSLIIQEVAMNHRKNLDAEIQVTSMEELDSIMTKLDFTLAPRPQKISQNFNLIGGRYCSIQANIAAQLKIAEIETGTNCTLYITLITKKLEKVVEGEFNYENTKIDIWKEDGKLYVLATGI